MSDSIHEIQSLPARPTELGSLKILRALPRRERRMVGPWCFLDRYGPLSFTAEKAMDVAPHPHIGIQTPARTFSPIIGADIGIRKSETMLLPLNSDFEHALFVLQGDVHLEGRRIEGATLHYLHTGRDELHLRATDDSRILMIAANPFRKVSSCGGTLWQERQKRLRKPVRIGCSISDSGK